MAKSTGPPRLFHVPRIEAKPQNVGRVRLGRGATNDSSPSRDDRRNDQTARRPSDSEVEKLGVFRRTRRRRARFATASKSGDEMRLRPKRQSIFRRKRRRRKSPVKRRLFRRFVESTARKSETKKKILRQIHCNLRRVRAAPKFYAPAPFSTPTPPNLAILRRFPMLRVQRRAHSAIFSFFALFSQFYASEPASAIKNRRAFEIIPSFRSLAPPRFSWLRLVRAFFSFDIQAIFFPRPFERFRSNNEAKSRSRRPTPKARPKR